MPAAGVEVVAGVKVGAVALGDARTLEERVDAELAVMFGAQPLYSFETSAKSRS